MKLITVVKAAQYSESVFQALSDRFYHPNNLPNHSKLEIHNMETISVLRFYCNILWCL